MEVKIEESLLSKEANNGIHKLVMSVLLAITVNPSTCIATYPYLAALGHVSEKLKSLYKWDDVLFSKIKQSCKAKNERINDAGLFQYFFDTLGKTLVTRPTDDTEVTPVTKVCSHNLQ